jgi:hypothetical protein
LAEKVYHPISFGNMAVAVVLSGIMNAAISFAGLLLCMPCMVSDALGSLTLVLYLKRAAGGRAKIPRTQALALGALSGLLGTIFLVGLLLVIFLIFGNLTSMVGDVVLFGNSISGIGTIPLWLVILTGGFIGLFKMAVNAIAVMALSSLDSF